MSRLVLAGRYLRSLVVVFAAARAVSAAVAAHQQPSAQAWPTYGDGVTPLRTIRFN